MLAKIIQWLQNLDDYLKAERRAINLLKSPQLAGLTLRDLEYMVEMRRQSQESSEYAKLARQENEDYIESLRQQTYQRSPEAWAEARKDSEQKWADAFKRAEENERIYAEFIDSPDVRAYKLNKDSYE